MTDKQESFQGGSEPTVTQLQKIGEEVHQMGLTGFTYWFEFRERLAALTLPTATPAQPPKRDLMPCQTCGNRLCTCPPSQPASVESLRPDCELLESPNSVMNFEDEERAAENFKASRGVESFQGMLERWIEWPDEEMSPHTCADDAQLLFTRLVELRDECRGKARICRDLGGTHATIHAEAFAEFDKRLTELIEGDK